uniref:Retrotransposon protein, putative, unclassified n=1 Tax=Oryza sativa subsp. japonica TaxID=39947 RepID=Q2QWT0_ORYSJ|nr:retrotransposon protein, putative, unclassified [Oryza sativa Japonica Group]
MNHAIQKKGKGLYDVIDDVINGLSGHHGHRRSRSRRRERRAPTRRARRGELTEGRHDDERRRKTAGDKLRRRQGTGRRRQRLFGDEQRQRRGGRASPWCCDAEGGGGTSRGRLRRRHGADGGEADRLDVGNGLPVVFGFGEVEAALPLFDAVPMEATALTGDGGADGYSRLERRPEEERDG